MSKGRYGNVKKPEFDGIRFDSHREMQRYCDLKLMQQAGVIKDLEVHPKYPITIGGIEIRIRSKRYWNEGRHLTYEADFSYIDLEKKPSRDELLEHGADWHPTVIVDVKMQSGHRTETYKIKRALMTAMGYTITEY